MLFDYNFWWNYVEFSNRRGLTVQMRILNNIKHQDTICSKFGDSFFTSLTMLRLESKESSTIKKSNFILL